MIPVTSSNVHSIGFRLDPNDSFDDLQSSKGTLLIRFLADTKGGKRTSPGALYEYHDVPARVFQEFRRAASKGGFVWDNVRVRGTVSGHKYSYDLAEIVNGYVPRQAGLKRGQQGEWYLKRRFRQGDNVFESRLPERQVKLSGPNRAEPNRGVPDSFQFLPNRGAPNRGR
jgi:KTSC domain